MLPANVIDEVAYCLIDLHLLENVEIMRTAGPPKLALELMRAACLLSPGEAMHGQVPVGLARPDDCFLDVLSEGLVAAVCG